MMTATGTLAQRTRATLDALRRVWANPDGSANEPMSARLPYYDLLWAYYSNQMFSSLDTAAQAFWTRYKERYNLYRYTRPLRNPTRRLVEFYVGEVYPGVLTEDAAAFPDGVPSAIPLPKDIDPELRAALGQFWQWSNWQNGKDKMVRFSAVFGACLVELSDDMTRRKVTAKVWYPGNVKALGLDDTGNVKQAHIAYEVDELDESGKPTGDTYTFSKVMTKETISYYKDGELFDYSGQDGRGAVVPNEYGFVPAVWVPHFSIGDDFGLPIIWATIDKIDELNSIVSMAHDQIAKIIKSPVVIDSPGGTGAIDKTGTQPKPADDPKRGREKVEVIHLPPGSSVSTLPLSLGDALNWVTNAIEEIEHDHPELSMYHELRSMSTVTGPAASRLMGDVGNLVYAAEASYDQQTVKLCQMALAMAGYHVNEGHWGNRSQLSRQQLKFAPFNLDSYGQGKLDFAILPRPLIEPTNLETWTAVKTQMEALSSKQVLGFPLPELQLEAGASQAQVDQWAQESQATVNDTGAALLNAFSKGAGMTPGQGVGASQNGSQSATGQA